MGSADFWKDNQVAAGKAAKLDLNTKITTAEKDLQDIFAVGEEADLDKATEIVEWLEAQTLFAGTHDDSDAYMSFHVGTGGVDAADFNNMLLTMYLAYAKRKGWTAEILDTSEGEEGGLKNATVKISGYRAYGHLKTEAGVHRLIRISPFNAQGLRQTSFALVEVLPELGEVDVALMDDDLKIETYKSSGKGGQSVNTTDSAVRITHIPTNLSVAMQNERSQMQNKEAALKLLKSKIFLLESEKREIEERKLKASQVSGDFGHQIRSYTLHPYQQVKDHRSGYETGKVEDVMQKGELDEIISSVLVWMRQNL